MKLGVILTVGLVAGAATAAYRYYQGRRFRTRVTTPANEVEAVDAVFVPHLVDEEEGKEDGEEVSEHTED